MAVVLTLALALVSGLAMAASDLQTEATLLWPPGPPQPLGSGNAVALDGDWAFVASLPSTSVLIFRREPTGWTFHQALRGPTSSSFGHRIAAASGVLVVGDVYAQSASGDVVGQALVYELQEDTWEVAQVLQPDELRAQDAFGASVAVSEDRIAVGAPGLDLPDMAAAGAVYTFRRAANGRWEVETRLDHPGDQAVYDRAKWMGSSVALSGSTLVTGAVTGEEAGAFVFQDGIDGWEHTGFLENPDPGHRYGESVAVCRDTIVVGDPRKFEKPGVAYVYQESPPRTWTLRQVIRASDGWADYGSSDYFSLGVATNGEVVVAGAMNGDVNGSDTGTVYLFVRDEAGGWPEFETRRLVSSDPFPLESLGIAVALEGPFVLAGATGAGSPKKKKKKGAGYVFELGLGTSFCTANPNSTGKAASLALLKSGSATWLSLHKTPPLAPCFLLAAPGGNMGLDQPLGNGRLCLAWRGVERLPLVLYSGSTGSLYHELTDQLHADFEPGTTWSLQAVYRDPGEPPAGFNTTNAVKVTLD